ncbi:MAG: acetyltransferase [Deltaproteobacteria bacterium]|nr:acetyltransferase [Deltaproteobacteria bacterium]
MNKKIILIGGGGHCKSCIDVIEQAGRYTIAGIVDLADKKGRQILSYKIIANDDDLEALAESHSFLITIGQIKTAAPRLRLYQRLMDLQADMPIIISPRAYVSPHAAIGRGSIVMHGAIVNAGAVVGNNCIVNSNALIEHDAEIGDHCHIATGALVNGGVKIGEQSFVGSRAVIREYTIIGRQSVIGGGAVIMRDILANSLIKAMGNE